jgi:hypothetical protein
MTAPAQKASGMLVAASAILVIAGCGPLPSQSSDGGGGGDKAVPTSFTDARHRYSITGPGPMTSKPDGSASFAHENERLDVIIVEGTAAADPAALADKDAGSLSSSTSSFRLVSRPGAVSIGGKQMVKFTYASTVSRGGGSLTVTTSRYYIPKNDQLLAVVTYADDSAEFSGSEADGILTTFQWL